MSVGELIQSLAGWEQKIDCRLLLREKLKSKAKTRIISLISELSSVAGGGMVFGPSQSLSKAYECA
jgi:hypothetical protein